MLGLDVLRNFPWSGWPEEVILFFRSPEWAPGLLLALSLQNLGAGGNLCLQWLLWPWRGRAWQWEAASADGTEPSLLLSSLLSGLKWHVEGCWCTVVLELCSEDSDPTGSQIKDWWIALRWSLPWTPLLHATLELASLSYCSCSSLLKDLLWKMRMGRLTCYPCNSSQ